MAWPFDLEYHALEVSVFAWVDASWAFVFARIYLQKPREVGYSRGRFHLVAGRAMTDD